ncbi:hypothetical protein M501DRAFT_1003322 [Patellaria atrata CBS 101060]|uniref:CREG-like beta-barrel domain-containing protein n=1 Tax=Patellaria atrata CBS 101060 TaxID=1346257 RepID=A0A9P4VSG9_9PEZI|nr:hypothetical protein M501DRAFT_1003322 [Patellaria atrata CBS 101060]
MRLTILPILPLSAAFSLSPQYLFSNPNSHGPNPAELSTTTFPTVHDSAVLGRRILHLESIGTLSTIFPSSSSHDAFTLENRPPSVAGTPVGLMDYIADCEPSTGNPTLLAITIATSFKNVAAGSNITLSLRWHAPYKTYSAAAMPRLSLIGHLENIDPSLIEAKELSKCFVKNHKDAVWWLPGNRIHESKWVRLVVDEVYWIGGFGNVAYIGWIPGEVWRNVTLEEIEEARLPGEKKGWSLLGYEL